MCLILYHHAMAPAGIIHGWMDTHNNNIITIILYYTHTEDHTK